MKNNYSIPSTFLESTSFFSKPTLFKSTSFSTTVSSFNKVEKKKSIDESSVNSSQMNYEKQLIVAMKRKTKLLNKHRRYNSMMIFQCPLCYNKQFISEEYLKEHINRRHQKRESLKEDNNQIKSNSKKNNNDYSIFSSLIKSNIDSINERITGIEQQVHKINQIKKNVLQEENTEEPAVKVIKNDIVKKKNELVLQALNKVKENIDKSNTISFHKLQDLKDDLDHFKLSISNELSNLKQMRSFERAKQLFQNEAEDSEYIFKKRRENHLKTVEMKQKLNKEELKRNTNKVPEPLIRKQKTEIKTKQNSFVITQEINESITEHSIKQANTQKAFIIKNSPLRKKKTNEIGKYKELIHTKYENKLNAFYKAFKTRDCNLDGKVSSYLNTIIPIMKKDKLNIIKKELFNEALFESLSIKNKKTFKMDKMNKDELIELIKRIKENIGDKSTLSDFFGYYSQNMDFCLNIKAIIDDVIKDYFTSKNNEKMKQREKDNDNESFGNIFNIINYNVITSGAFSFTSE